MNITDSAFQIESSLPLPEDEVHLWRVDLEAVGGDEFRWQQVLSSEELTRAGRFHLSRDRQRFVASRAWLRTILAGYLKMAPSSLSFSYSKKEKPALGPPFASSNITFNVSHSGRIALLAFTRGREIGSMSNTFAVIPTWKASHAASFPQTSGTNSLRCPPKKELPHSSAAGPAKRRTSRQPETAYRFPWTNSTFLSGPGNQTPCWQRGPMLQKQDGGFSVRCRLDPAIWRHSASSAMIGSSTTGQKSERPEPVNSLLLWRRDKSGSPKPFVK